MVSKATISFVQSLKQKKYRQKYNKFILEGEKIIIEGLKEGIISFDTIFCLPEKLHLLEDHNVKGIEINAKTLNKISNLRTPPGILAIANTAPLIKVEELDFEKVGIFLDDIKDPGNLGTIIRTAEWFGVKRIIVSPETVEIHNPKVIQASMGSFARIEFSIESLNEIKKTNPNLSIIASVLGGDNLYEFQPKFPLLLIVGNESKGISAETLKHCDQKLAIPQGKNSKAESLNAAIANAIFVSYFMQKA